MAKFVALTDFWTAQKVNQNPGTVYVNIDLAKTIKRLAAVKESASWSAMPERTEIWFAGHGIDSAETVTVTETPEDIMLLARLEVTP